MLWQRSPSTFNTTTKAASQTTSNPPFYAISTSTTTEVSKHKATPPYPLYSFLVALL